MKNYILKFQNENEGKERFISFISHKSALIYSRQYNADKTNTNKILDILIDNGESILDKTIPNNIKRISEYLSLEGFKLKHRNSVYVIESDRLKLLDIVQELKTMVNEDLNGHILWGSICLNAQKNKYLYRVIFE